MNHLEDMDFLLPIPLIATNYGLQQIDKYGLSESEC